MTTAKPTFTACPELFDINNTSLYSTLEEHVKKGEIKAIKTIEKSLELDWLSRARLAELTQKSFVVHHLLKNVDYEMGMEQSILEEELLQLLKHLISKKQITPDGWFLKSPKLASYLAKDYLLTGEEYLDTLHSQIYHKDVKTLKQLVNNCKNKLIKSPTFFWKGPLEKPAEPPEKYLPKCKPKYSQIHLGKHVHHRDSQFSQYLSDKSLKKIKESQESLEDWRRTILSNVKNDPLTTHYMVEVLKIKLNNL